MRSHNMLNIPGNTAGDSCGANRCLIDAMLKTVLLARSANAADHRHPTRIRCQPGRSAVRKRRFIEGIGITKYHTETKPGGKRICRRG